jgi:hypothetical protein
MRNETEQKKEQINGWIKEEWEKRKWRMARKKKMQ